MAQITHRLPECSLRSWLRTLGCICACISPGQNFYGFSAKVTQLRTVVTGNRSAPKSPAISIFDRTYLNSSETIWTQEAFTLCSDVCPAPFKQVDDGGPAVPGVRVVLGEGEPEQSHQNEQLHDFFAHPGVSFRRRWLCIYIFHPLHTTNGEAALIGILNRCNFLTLTEDLLLIFFPPDQRENYYDK